MPKDPRPIHSRRTAEESYRCTRSLVVFVCIAVLIALLRPVMEGTCVGRLLGTFLDFLGRIVDMLPSYRN